MDEAPRKSGLGRLITTWGPVVGFIGGVMGAIGGVISVTGAGLSLLDRFYPPTVEILDLTPVYISEPRVILGANSAIRGVGVLLHVRAGNRPISLTGLELAGKRCVSFDEFPGLVEADGKTFQELEAEFNRRRPFQQVSFLGLPTDRAGPVLLTPWEESYVHFTFLEPTIGTTPSLLTDQRFFGSEQQPFPMTRRYGFNVHEMFTLAPSERTSWTAGHLRNEILDGVLVFRVLASGEPISVSTNAVRAPKRLTPDVWKKGDLGPLLAEREPSLERKPTKNRSINCYTQSPKSGERMPAHL